MKKPKKKSVNLSDPAAFAAHLKEVSEQKCEEELHALFIDSQEIKSILIKYNFALNVKAEFRADHNSNN